jgi:hypothetical protein
LIVDLNVGTAFSSQKLNPSFVDLYVGIAKFGKCCDVVLLGHICGYITLWQNPITIFNAYMQVLQMWVK